MGAKKWAALIASFLGLGGCAGEICSRENANESRFCVGRTIDAPGANLARISINNAPRFR